MSTVFLLDPSSTLVTNIVTKTGSKMSIGNQSLSFPYNQGYTIALNVQGATCTNNHSAFQVPADTSANRPAGQPGYIRYNTDSYALEYWNTLTNDWLAVSSQPPSISNVIPSYVNQDNSFNTYTITGSFFNTNSFVSFLGVNDSVEYGTSSGTTFVTSNSLIATATYAMSGATVNTSGFYIRVTNGDSGVTNTYTTPLTFNNAPIWQTAVNANLGTSVFDQSFTVFNTPYTAINASDIHPPISYYYTTAPAGAALVLLDASSGKLKGTNPSYSGSGTSTTFSFSAQAQDSLGANSVIRQFAFTVNLPIATITGGTSIVGFTDASGNGFSSTSQYTNGYTVYIFTAGTATFATVSIFPPYISYLVIGGGGAGGSGDSGGSGGGGGGAGGYRTGYTAVTAGTSYTVTVGNGGTGVTGTGNNGGSSSITGTGISITSAGGGGGGNNFNVGSAGASGGGGGLRQNKAGGAGNTPSTTPEQGNAGGFTLVFNTGGTGRGGGGGSALARGGGGYGNSETSTQFALGPGGTGGSGISNNIRGTGLVVYSGGGGAGSFDRMSGVGGSGGGGSGSGSSGATVPLGYAVVGTAGTANTGGGGGGTATGAGTTATIAGGAGGSGIVILRHLTSVISSSIPAAFTINGVTFSGSPISGTYKAVSGYNAGTTLTPGTATVTYVDSTGRNPRAFSLGAYTGGYTIVNFVTTTPTSQFTWNGSTGTFRPSNTSEQVLYYGNTTDFSFNATTPFPAQVEFLIVAGGGTGAKGTGAITYGGGGGAGQVLAGTTSISTGFTYTVKVGSGGVMDPNGTSGNPDPGGNGVFYNLTKSGVSSSAFGLSAIGGFGGNGGTPPNTVDGGLGQGGASGNGFLGGQGSNNPAGGGGGASDFGRVPSSSWTNSGGFGIASAISGTYTGYGGGGSGGGDVNTSILIGGTSPAGVVIGGKGGTSSGPTNPTAGIANTGSGGGGMRADDIGAGGGGGTGIIIIKFPSFVC